MWQCVSKKLIVISVVVMPVFITACGGSSGNSTVSGSENNVIDTGDDSIVQTPDDTQDDQSDLDGGNGVSDPGEEQLSQLDEQLIGVIERENLDEDPLADRDLPSILSPLAQLGKKLFFSKSLGGAFDAACVSCHHPMLGGADDLSLPVGVDALDPDLLGVGREHIDGLPSVPRNAPTVFNVGLWDTGLFWDSRVESLGKEEGANGSLSDIRTPDSSFNNADSNAGPNLAAAQARFPVTSAEEMKSSEFESGSTNAEIRAHLAARIGDYGVGAGELARNEWLSEFQEAFGVTQSSETLITFDNIALAIGEYERSMVFIDSPWRQYIEGDRTALTDNQKRGALLFFGRPQDNGAGCVNCHNGPLLSDGEHHVVAFPQIGPGKGDGGTGDDDFGRERETGEQVDRYRFRTPSLLNISVSAPYGHAGVYESLQQVVRHYDNPGREVDDYFDDQEWCDLPQFELINNCESLYSNGRANSQAALNKLEADRRADRSQLPNINLNQNETQQLVEFLESLTDPCVTSRTCMAPWIASGENDNPDDQMLEAMDQNGDLL